jgi:hypothetical protein
LAPLLVGVIVLALASVYLFILPLIYPGTNFPLAFRYHIQTDSHHNSSAYVLTENAPDLTGAATDDIPSDIDANCPEQMSAIAWSKFSDGYVLICVDSTHDFAALSSLSGQIETATQLTFFKGGYTVEFKSGYVTVQLGGAYVEWQIDGSTTIEGASNAYLLGKTSQIHISGSTDALKCPSDSTPMSISTWSNGFVLVCGTNGSATAMTLMNSGSVTTASDVSTTLDGVDTCGTTSTGLSLCLYPDIGLVTLGSDQNNETQYLIENSYSDATG